MGIPSPLMFIGEFRIKFIELNSVFLKIRSFFVRSKYSDPNMKVEINGLKKNRLFKANTILERMMNVKTERIYQNYQSFISIFSFWTKEWKDSFIHSSHFWGHFHLQCKVIVRHQVNGDKEVLLTILPINVPIDQCTNYDKLKCLDFMPFSNCALNFFLNWPRVSISPNFFCQTKTHSVSQNSRHSISPTILYILYWKLAKYVHHLSNLCAVCKKNLSSCLCEKALSVCWWNRPLAL